MTIDPGPIPSCVCAMPPRKCLWQLSEGRSLALGGCTKIMGILNVTPDSFSDGGHFLDTQRAVDRGLEMAQQGAAIIDVGGESSRPGADPVSLDDELERTIPVVSELAARTESPISIDTTKYEVAKAALKAGAAIINDISGFSFDPRMAGLAAATRAGAVVMHMRGIPRTMQQNPSYADTVVEVCRELGRKVAKLLDAGVGSGQIVVDPGIGFAKAAADNLRILAHLEALDTLGYPLLLGCSRKSFLGAGGVKVASDRLPETLATSVVAALCGCHLVRVHDVAENRRALDVITSLFEVRR